MFQYVLLYKNNDGYSYTDPVELDTNGGEFSYKGDKSGLDSYIYSHGGYDPNYNSEEFSAADKASAEGLGIDAYVTTPGGKLLKYINALNRVVQLSNDMPKDPKYE